MFKFLIFIVAGVVLWKLFTGDKKQKAKVNQQEKEAMAATGEMVKDPICGSFVSKESDIRVKAGDKTMCFCSYECRDKFLKQIRAEQDSDA
ncbi:transcriptional regulator [Desulfovibrio inopinatus]|uniref:transcriptional regulator n=1 Tax=Desulfovibrio inopinatus TaxID=102109 RepID=UPI000428BAE3|nr:transcriptional regulator [Desulfovibrio inopinatus]